MTVVMAMILSLFLFINRRYSSTAMLNNVESTSFAYLESIKKMTDNLVDTLDSYSLICLSNRNVQQMLERKANGEDEFTLINEVNGYLSELVTNSKQLQSIYIYSNDDLIASADQGGQHFPIHRKIQDYSWYSSDEAGEYYVDFSSHDFNQSMGEKSEVCFRRAIRSMKTFKTIGYMLITVRNKELSNLLVVEEAEDSDSVFCLLSDEKNVTVISDDKFSEEMKTIGEEMIGKGILSSIRTIDHKKYMCCMIESDQGYFMDAVSIDSAYRRFSNSNRIQIMLILIQGIITLVTIFVITRAFTYPMHKLIISMNEITNGKFVPVEMKTNDYEIRQLVDVYNEMIQTINRLIEQAKEAEKMKGEANLKALTAQINPHFLYNTFDSVKALFVLKRYDDAAYMINSLSRFYKINLSKGEEYITVEKNLDMLSSYVAIQQMRFGGEFTYHAYADPQVRQWKILKMCIQPLLENAINHGIHGYTEEGKIELEITRTGESSLQIILSDNGCGMSEETLNKVISGEEGVHGRSFGVFATMNRLEYCYGDQMSYAIDSKVGEGTRVTIQLELRDTDIC